MSEYSAIVTAIIAATVALIVAWWKRPKDIVDTLAAMRKEYEENFQELLDTREEMRKERKAREDEKRGEYLSREREKLESEQKQAIALKDILDIFDRYKRDKELETSLLINQIDILTKGKEKSDRENIELRKLVQEHGGQIEQLSKKVTGQLPAA